MLIDTGPLVALLDQRDAQHALCTDVARRLPRASVVTTWPCFTEAMHFLLQSAGNRGTAALWQFLASRKLQLHDVSAAEVDRMAMLMAQYDDLPMDLADASLVAAAECRSFRQIFTLDGDFRIYRLADGSTLEVIP